MKQKLIILLFVTAFIPHYLQAQGSDFFRQEGIASWYGKEFDGRPTASGEIFDSAKLTAAHPNLPFGTLLVVTNQHNNKKVTVKVNDRGPFVAARIIDVSRAAAEQLDMIVTGTAPVLVESVERITSPAAVEPAVKSPSVETPANETPAAQTPVSTNVKNTQFVYAEVPNEIKLKPEKIIIEPGKKYRLQVGSYTVARNAVDTFEKLKNSGLSPAYERYRDPDNKEYFRVVLASIAGVDVQSITEKLLAAGFTEALIREE